MSLVRALSLAALLAALLCGVLAEGAPPDRSPAPFDQKVAPGSRLAFVPSPSPLRRWVPPKTSVVLRPGDGQRSDRFVIKFSEELRVRLRGGHLVELDGQELPGVLDLSATERLAGLERLFSRSENHLDRDRSFAAARSGFRPADLNNYYLVYLAEGMDPLREIQAWLALDVIEIAYFEGLATDPQCDDVTPTTPDFESSQDYLEPAPQGVDALFAWNYDPAGAGVPDYWFIDVEQAWNVDHEDFGDIQILNGDPGSGDHGTAVLGEVVGCDSGFGITGIASGITAGVVDWGNESSIADAFDVAASFLQPGEVYLIEIHTLGPGPIPGTSCQCNCGQFGYVPMEVEQANFDAIQTHVASGIVVVEAGGNGGMDLDDPFYGGIFDRNVRDSGAIVVGAGNPGQHLPECWTNHGSRIDCQGFGSSVVTTGYGSLFDPGDGNQIYANTFSGTSSASPIVTGCVAVLQSISAEVHGQMIDPLFLRDALSTCGTPQGGSFDRPIGVLPDLQDILENCLVGVRVALIDPLPELVPPLEPLVVDVEITTFADTVVPGSELIYYRFDGGLFQSAPLEPLGGSLFRATLPAPLCGDVPQLYLSVAGVESGVSLDPSDAPASVYSTVVAVTEVLFQDDLESDLDWVAGVAGDDATTGVWVRVDPLGTGAQPEDDHTLDPGVTCWVTGQGTPGGSIGENDVDGGQTTLVTPNLALAATPGAHVGYWRWYSNTGGADPGNDIFLVEISNDDGQSWVSVETVGPVGPESSGGWYRHEFAVADLVTPTDEVRLRFVASDLNDGSIVEAAIDDLEVFTVSCLGCPSPFVRGDANQDGTVDLVDATAIIDQVFGTGTPPDPAEAADVNDDGTTNLADAIGLLAYLFQQGAPPAAPFPDPGC